MLRCGCWVGWFIPTLRGAGRPVRGSHSRRVRKKKYLRNSAVATVDLLLNQPPSKELTTVARTFAAVADVRGQTQACTATATTLAVWCIFQLAVHTRVRTHTLTHARTHAHNVY